LPNVLRRSIESALQSGRSIVVNIGEMIVRLNGDD
jgi:hypothetical protein